MKKLLSIMLMLLLMLPLTSCSDKGAEAQNESSDVRLDTQKMPVLEVTDVESSAGEETEETFEDSIFISDEVYMDAVSSLGEENALQLRTFAENYQQWVPEEGEIFLGATGFAICDLDGDGHLELLRTQVQGTGLYAVNSFYQADVDNGQVYELEQQTSPEELAFEIGGQTEVYTDQEGSVFYMAADYGKAGLQFSSCTEGYYYLKNKTIISEKIRSYTLEYDEMGKGTYTYYLSGQEMPVTESEWAAARQTFLENKTLMDSAICWRELYGEEITAKKVQGWFLLLAESLRGR